VAQFSSLVHPALEAHGRAARPTPSPPPPVANPRLAADIARAADQHQRDTQRAQAIVQSRALADERAQTESRLQPARTPVPVSSEAAAQPGQYQQWPEGPYLPAPAFTYPVRCESSVAPPAAGGHACRSPSAAQGSRGVGGTPAVHNPSEGSSIGVAGTGLAASAATHAASAQSAPPSPAAAMTLGRQSDCRTNVPSAGSGSPTADLPGVTASPAASPAGGRLQQEAVGPHSPVGGLSAQKFVGTAISVRQAWGKLPGPAQPPAEGPRDSPGSAALASASSPAEYPAAASAAVASTEEATAASAAAAAVAKAAAASGGVEPDCSRVILHFDVDAMYAQVHPSSLTLMQVLLDAESCTSGPWSANANSCVGRWAQVGRLRKAE